MILLRASTQWLTFRGDLLSNFLVTSVSAGALLATQSPGKLIIWRNESTPPPTPDHLLRMQISKKSIAFWPFLNKLKYMFFIMKWVFCAEFFVNIYGYRICNPERWFHGSTLVQGTALAHSIVLFKNQLKASRWILWFKIFFRSIEEISELPLNAPTPIQPCKDCKTSVVLYFILHFGRWRLTGRYMVFRTSFRSRSMNFFDNIWFLSLTGIQSS